MGSPSVARCSQVTKFRSRPWPQARLLPCREGPRVGYPFDEKPSGLIGNFTPATLFRVASCYDAQGSLYARSEAPAPLPPTSTPLQSVPRSRPSALRSPPFSELRSLPEPSKGVWRGRTYALPLERAAA